MKKLFSSLFLLTFIIGISIPTVDAASDEGSYEKLLQLIEKSVTYAEQGDLNKAQKELHEIHETWEVVEDDIEESSPESYEAIESSMSKAEALFQGKNTDKEKAVSALMELKRVVEQAAGIDAATSDKRTGAKVLKGLSHELEETSEFVKEGDWAHAKKEYEAYHEGWESIEESVRSADSEAYESIETKMGLVDSSLDASSNPEKAVENLDALISAIQSFTDEKETSMASTTKEPTSGKGNGIQTLVDILAETKVAIESGDTEKAAAHMEEFISIWPSIEGEVSTRSANVYESIENEMTNALGLLYSNPPKTEQAKEVVSDMTSQLKSVMEKTSYSMWDAMIILLREGLEIILVLSALLAFLKKSGNADKRVWIWGGAGAGVLASVGLAFLLTSVMAAAVSAQNREFIEGITGLVAVLLMFTVGAWLHKKSNIESWNNYIRDSVSTALARGSLWSLAGIAFITVVREGAETIIFYLGLSADISRNTLFSGIAIAAAILVVLGFTIMFFSVKVPVRGLFLSITVFIYYLAFKFTGESLHALQVVKKVPSHSIPGLPEISWIGVYPTWETTIAQMLLLALIISQTVRVKKKQGQKKQNALQSPSQVAQR